MVSLHGGHSGDFCDHAVGTLDEMLEAAIAAGYDTFGVSEHAPRGDARFLYPEEIALGWDVAKTENDFARYTQAIQAAAEKFAPRLIVLRGFEAEIVPRDSYAARMRRYREQMLSDGAPAFDYFVGSVHFVEEIQIDGPPATYLKAVEACGGIEALAVRYYTLIAEMIETLRPDVVGHLDLIKKNWAAAGFADTPLDSPPLRAAAERALEAARAHDAILDLNTAGWRKGLGEPYPAPWLVERAKAMGVGFCFGDDSHRPADVGAGVREARDYLLRLGVETITCLTREGDDRAHGPVVRRVVNLL
jgi:histidinol-phosphatase (PHP family)